MFEARLPSRTWIFATLLATAAGLVLVGMGHGEPPRTQESDLLDHVRRLEKVAAQKVESDLRDLLRELERLSTTRPAKALERLKLALGELDDETALAADRRAAYKRVLKDRIRVLEGEPAKVVDNKPLPTVPNRQANEERRKSEREQINEGLKRIRELQKEGKTGEASREAEKLAHDFPLSTAADASTQTATNLDQLSAARRQVRERDGKFTGVQRDIARSATPSAGDIDFPKDYKERTKGRSTAIKLTDKEKALVAALKTPITVNFRGTRLEDVVSDLELRLGVTIFLDQEAMKDIELSYDSPVTLKLRSVPARTVIRKIFSDLGLTYVLKDEVIQATSHEKARRMMVVRSYYVGDLLMNLGGLGQPSLSLNPFAGQLPALGFNPLFPQMPGVVVSPLGNQLNQLNQANQAKESVNQLIDLIKSSVDSQSWQGHGGDGSITYNAASMSLVIRQSAEIHALLANSGLAK